MLVEAEINHGASVALRVGVMMFQTENTEITRLLENNLIKPRIIYIGW